MLVGAAVGGDDDPRLSARGEGALVDELTLDDELTEDDELNAVDEELGRITGSAVIVFKTTA